MRFTCEKNTLVNGLNVTGRVVAQKSAMSALEGILCHAGADLTLTGYNMETAISCKVEADIGESGQCVLPARLFGDIVRRLPEGPVTVTVDENYKVLVRAGNASFSISAETAEDYPELPDVSGNHGVSVPQSALKELINATIFAVSAENQGRPIHTGIKFEMDESALTCIALDGFRLARRTYRIPDNTGRQLNFVVPAQGLKEVEKILSEEEGEVCFTLGKKHIMFQMGTVTLICRLLDGEFLDWRRVVPTDCPIKVEANVGEFASSIERVGLIVSEKYKSPVICEFGDQTVKFSTTNNLGTAEDRCTIAGNGNDMKIGLNVRYLGEALRVIDEEEVTVELTNSISPIVFTPAGGGDDYAYMILPVRI